jgi:hypothetical protein
MWDESFESSFDSRGFIDLGFSGCTTVVVASVAVTVASALAVVVTIGVRSS